VTEIFKFAPVRNVFGELVVPKVDIDDTSQPGTFTRRPGSGPFDDNFVWSSEDTTKTTAVKTDEFHFDFEKATKAAPTPDPFGEPTKAPELYTSQAFKKFIRNYDPDAEDDYGTFRKSREKFAVGMNVVLLSDGKRRKMKLTKLIPVTNDFFLCDGDWVDESGSVRGIFSGAELAIAA
jgi:hypothetical protein